MPKESRIQLVEKRLTKIEQAVTNDIPHQLAMHDKFIYTILAFFTGDPWNAYRGDARQMNSHKNRGR